MTGFVTEPSSSLWGSGTSYIITRYTFCSRARAGPTVFGFNLSPLSLFTPTGIEPVSLALAGRFSALDHQGSPIELSKEMINLCWQRGKRGLGVSTEEISQSHKRQETDWPD